MPRFEITGPDGSRYQVDGPEGATEQDALAQVQKQAGAASVSPTPTPSLADYAGTVDTDALASVPLPSSAHISTSIRDALAPAPNTTYGSVLPLAKDDTTGAIRPALPSMIRSPLIGLTEGPQVNNGKLEVPAATINPESGTLGITPEAASVAAFSATPLRFGGIGLADAAAIPPRITAREVQARDDVGIMEAWRRAHAENRAPPAAIADIGTAPDIDTAIAAFGKAAEGSSGAIPTVTVTAAAPERVATAIPKTSSEAKAVATAYYQRADQVGGTLLPEFTNKFIDEAESIAPQTMEGRAIAGDTQITGLVDRIQALRDQPISLRGAQEIDERLGDMIDKEYGLKGLSKEGHNLLDLQTTFRNMILDAGPEDTTSGIAGFEAIKQGRLAWAQAMKMMDFERILNRAEQTDNPVTSIRAGIRTLTSNPSRVRGYSPEEIDALKDAAKRGVIGGVLHVFGSRLTPLAVGAAGLSSGIIPGLIGAGVTHGAAAGMRNLATRIQTGRADNAMSVLGSGVPSMPAELSSGALPRATPLPQTPYVDVVPERIAAD